MKSTTTRTVARALARSIVGGGHACPACCRAELEAIRLRYDVEDGIDSIARDILGYQGTLPTSAVWAAHDALHGDNDGCCSVAVTERRRIALAEIREEMDAIFAAYRRIRVGTGRDEAESWMLRQDRRISRLVRRESSLVARLARPRVPVGA